MKEINEVGLIAITLIVVSAANFLLSAYSSLSLVNFILTCCITGYLASNLQKKIKEKEKW